MGKHYKLLEELDLLALPSKQRIIGKLKQLNQNILHLVAQKEQYCPPEILQAIREQLSSSSQQQFGKNLNPVLSLRSSSQLTNKERFDNEWKGASEKQQDINPALKEDYEAQRTELLKRLYQVAVDSHKKCQLTPQGQPTCFVRMQAAFLDMKKSMDPRDQRQAIIDSYLKSTGEFINAVVYRGELFIWDKEPNVRDRYKNGPRINATEYLNSLKTTATALNTPVDPKQPDKKPKANFTIDRIDILVLLSQFLVQEEKGCQDRNSWGAAAQRAFQRVKSHLYSNLNGSEEIAGELDSLLKEMWADAQKEWPLIVAGVIWRDLPPAERAKLPEPLIKDEEHFNKEMSGAPKNIQFVNPASSSDKGDKEEEGSDLEKQLRKATKDFAGNLLGKVFQKVTGAIQQKVS